MFNMQPNTKHITSFIYIQKFLLSISIGCYFEVWNDNTKLSKRHSLLLVSFKSLCSSQKETDKNNSCNDDSQDQKYEHREVYSETVETILFTGLHLSSYFIGFSIFSSFSHSCCLLCSQSFSPSLCFYFFFQFSLQITHFL